MLFVVFLNSNYKSLTALLFFSFFLVFVSRSASADGFGLIHDPDMELWSLMSERKQYAAINYVDGVEKMILVVNAELSGDKAVWLFPVPASPDKVEIDVVTGFPQLRGRDI
ncbi:MAG: hypothetical protein QW343_03680 [Candidatus Norongarragalinales archaeon]